MPSAIGRKLHVRRNPWIKGIFSDTACISTRSCIHEVADEPCLGLTIRPAAFLPPPTPGPSRIAPIPHHPASPRGNQYLGSPAGWASAEREFDQHTDAQTAHLLGAPYGKRALRRCIAAGYQLRSHSRFAMIPTFASIAAAASRHKSSR